MRALVETLVLKCSIGLFVNWGLDGRQFMVIHGRQFMVIS